MLKAKLLVWGTLVVELALISQSPTMPDEASLTDEQAGYNQANYDMCRDSSDDLDCQ